ncbi:transposase [Streptomyces sp. NPDC030920]|uniref:transposase n=1 Tax=Streptomyces sp. NPDC030920 TaxID=3365308 RepID=UPI00384BAD0E
MRWHGGCRHVRPAGKTEHPFADHRRVIDGIIYQYRTGLPWRDLPREMFGPWQTARHNSYPCAELDHHGPASTVLTVCRDLHRLQLLSVLPGHPKMPLTSEEPPCGCQVEGPLVVLRPFHRPRAPWDLEVRTANASSCLLRPCLQLRRRWGRPKPGRADTAAAEAPAVPVSGGETPMQPRGCAWASGARRAGLVLDLARRVPEAGVGQVPDGVPGLVPDSASV